MKKEFYYFLTIYQEGSYTGASKRLFVSQPYLSKFIKDLENELGGPVFYRDNPISLTPIGESYYKYIISVTELERQLFSEINKINLKKEFTINIGIVRWRAPYWIPRLYDGLKDEYPNTRINFVEDSYINLCHKLENGITDFNIIQTYLNTKYNFYHFYFEDILFVTYKSNPNLDILKFDPGKKINVISVEEFSSCFKNQPFVMLHEESFTRQILNDFLDLNNIVLNVPVEVTNLATARNFVSLELGNSFLPSSQIPLEGDNSNLIFFKIENSGLLWNVGIEYIKEEKTTNIYDEVIKSCESIIRPMNDWWL